MSRREIVGINLLRREARKPSPKKAIKVSPGLKRPLEFNRDMAVIGVLFLVFLVAFGGYYFNLKKTVASKEKLLVKKKAELKRLEKVYARIKMLEARKRDIQRMIKVIQTLSQGRDRMVKFFDGLEKDIPGNSWLSSLQLKGDAVQMKGYSLEDNGVADFMENLSREKSVSRCSLQYIKEVTLAGIKVREFSLVTFFRQVK